MSTRSRSSWLTGSRIQLAANLDVVSREEIERLQAHNLMAMVEAAVATPAVHQRFPGVEAVTNATELARLPLMSATDLANDCPPHSDELLLGGSGPGLVLRSSGTSGRRKILYHSWLFNQQVGLLGVRGVRSALPDPPCRLANCLSAGDLNGGFTFVQDIGQRLAALTFPCGSMLSFAEFVELLVEHKVDTLASTPALAVELCTHPARPATLRSVLYIGEAMGDARASALAAAAPDVVVRSLAYSTSETGPVGYQCPHVSGTTHHVHEDAVIVEIIDEHIGLPVPDGQAGEVVITPLTDTGMALFRYRIGDRGWLHTEPCTCGSAARLLTLEGRVGQSLTVDSDTISSNLLMSRLGELGITNPMDCQFQVLWNGDTFQVRLLLSERTSEELTTEVVARTLCGAYHLNSILKNRRCTGFTMERVERTRFAQNVRGKIPLFYQRHDLRRSTHDTGE
jgi:phenylacetate-CoA ligase